MAGVEFKTTVFTADNAQGLVQVLLMVLGVVYLVQLGKVGREGGREGGRGGREGGKDGCSAGGDVPRAAWKIRKGERKGWKRQGI